MMKGTTMRLIVVALIAAASVGLYGFWYSVVMAEQSRVETLRTEVAGKNEAAMRVSSARNALETLNEDEVMIDQYFVTQEELVDFFEELERAGDDLGASVEIVSVSEGQATDTPSLTVLIKLRGSFDAVLRTLGVIEYGKRDTVLTQLSLDRGGGEDGPSWSASATLSVGMRSRKEQSSP